MSTNGPGIRAHRENNVGGDAAMAALRLKDMAPSRSDPHDDLVMPHLPTPAWRVLLDSRKESDVLNALRAVMAWKAAGRLRRLYRWRLWPGEEAADAVTLPTTFPLAEQSGADETEIKDDINRLEQWAFELTDLSPDLTRQVLEAGKVALWADSRLGVLRKAASKDAQARKDSLASNKLAVEKEVHTHGYLESRWGETKRMIEASAGWGLYLARYFDGLRNLTQKSVFDLGQPWRKPQNQGRTAGCVGHAVADLLMSQLNDEKIVPSARYLWQGAKELDGESRPTTFVARAGTSVRGALQLVKKVGCATEGELPSDSLELYSGTLGEFYEHVGKRKVAGVVNLGLDKKMWLSWVALGRPVVCAIRAKEGFVNPGTGSPQLDNLEPGDRGFVNHAVVIVGWRLAPETFSELAPSYDLVDGAIKADTKAIDDPTTYFPVQYLVRNTVGEGWGAAGYAWVPHRLMRLIAHEAYGVLLADEEVTRPVAAPEGKRSWAASAAQRSPGSAGPDPTAATSS
jgi:hypothetical protein